MPKTLQLRRGTTAEITANTPASGELFVDTEKKTVTVGDGSTAGGIILARNDRVSDVYNTANGANGLAAGAYDRANTASSNTVIIQGVDTWQNTQITQVNQFAQAAYNQANTGGGSTGSFTFTSNNITLTGNQNAVMNVSGNVFTFESDGTFISDTAWLGDVLVTNDILTPLSYDVYGNTQTGILTVNGNLNVTGTITGGKFESFASTTNTAEKYKTYLQGGVATSFTLPSNGEVGDWLQVIGAGINVVIPASALLTGFVSGNAGQTVNLGNIQKINLFVCELVSGGTSYWRVYGLSQTPYLP